GGFWPRPALRPDLGLGLHRHQGAGAGMAAALGAGDPLLPGGAVARRRAGLARAALARPAGRGAARGDGALRLGGLSGWGLARLVDPALRPGRAAFLDRAALRGARRGGLPRPPGAGDGLGGPWPRLARRGRARGRARGRRVRAAWRAAGPRRGAVPGGGHPGLRAGARAGRCLDGQCHPGGGGGAGAHPAGQPGRDAAARRPQPDRPLFPRLWRGGCRHRRLCVVLHHAEAPAAGDGRGAAIARPAGRRAARLGAAWGGIGLDGCRRRDGDAVGPRLAVPCPCRI
ncbi:MAG: Permease of the drug/metabolite transporter (DMT) superfamily, partial [uncultured Craurococcus sp.]